MDHFLDLIRFAQHRNSLSCLVDVLFADQTDGAQTDLGLPLQPLAQLFGSATGANQQCFFFVSKNSAGENRWEIIMREQERDIEPRNEVEKENTRNERVLC